MNIVLLTLNLFHRDMDMTRNEGSSATDRMNIVCSEEAAEKFVEKWEWAKEAHMKAPYMMLKLNCDRTGTKVCIPSDHVTSYSMQPASLINENKKQEEQGQEATELGSPESS